MAYFFANIKILHIIECYTAFWKEDLYKSNGYNEKVTRLGHKDNELVCILINSRTEKRIIKSDAATLKKLSTLVTTK
mgnify:FL=1